MSISIVIVSYNSSDLIPKLFKSIEEQDFNGRIQIILIDNNSQDSSRLRSYLRAHNIHSPRCSLKVKFLKKNKGFGNSCNLGATIANNELLLFLNPDAILSSNSLSILHSHYLKNNADIIGGKSELIESEQIHRTIYKIPTVRTMLFEFSNLGRIFGISGNFYINQNCIRKDTVVDGIGAVYLLISKKKFLKMSGFDDNFFMYLEDVDLCQRAHSYQYKIIYCPHSIIKHVGGASSNNKYRIKHEAWFDSRKYYARKHFSVLTNIVLQVIYVVEELMLKLITNL